jgi:hypothetical protein
VVLFSLTCPLTHLHIVLLNQKILTLTGFSTSQHLRG